MPAVDFEEKEFETLANASLLAGAPGGVKIFSPGQVLEATLGFDFSMALSPTSKAAQILRKSFPTRSGVTPTAAAASGLPAAVSGMFLNLFLQYKRPTHFRTGHRSALWPTGEEFLRFDAMQRKRIGGVSNVNFDQVEAMADLETQFGVQAQVRYVCPGFVTRDALYSHFAAGDLLARSTFVEPWRLRLGSGFHSYWTYQSKKLDTGQPNPGGPFEDAKNGQDFFADMQNANVPASSLDEFTYNSSLAAARAKEGDSWKRRRGRERSFAEQEAEHRTDAAEEVRSVFGTSQADQILQTIETAAVARTLDLEWMIVEA
jgi:hypothetical protein